MSTFASVAVTNGLHLLETYPERALLDAAWSRFPDSSLTRTAFGKAFKAAVAGSAELSKVVAENIAAFPKPLKLICTAASEPKTASELTESRRGQLRAAGKLYDDQDLPADIRLGDPNEETTLSLELRTISDAKGTPLYDAFLYNADSGTIFRSGTLEIVAEILQGSLECADDILADALKPLVRSPAKVTAPKPEKAKKLK